MKAAFHFLTIIHAARHFGSRCKRDALSGGARASGVTLYTKAFVGDLLFHVLVESDPSRDCA